MSTVSIPKLTIRRLASDWRLWLNVFIGAVLSISIASGTPVYINSLAKISLDSTVQSTSPLILNIYSTSDEVPINSTELDAIESSFANITAHNLEDIYHHHDRYLKIDGTIDSPEQYRGEEAFIVNTSNLEDHVIFTDGRMATGQITSDTNGPIIEAVVGAPLVDKIYKLQVGDTLSIQSGILTPPISIKIVGIAEMLDDEDPYWQWGLKPIFDNRFSLDWQGNNEYPPIGLMIHRSALTTTIAKTYPHLLAESTWAISVNQTGLQRLPPEEIKTHLNNLEIALSKTNPRHYIFTGLDGLLDRFEERRFTSSIPTLLLLTNLGGIALYFMAMMIHQLIQSRESDNVMFRSRGAGSLMLLRLHAPEILLVTILSVSIAPFFAIGLISLAGKLPYFREFTGGNFIPIEINYSPFVISITCGVIFLITFLAISILRSKTNLINHKLKSSRPQAQPFFQQYYLDVALVIIVAFLFWELDSRETLIVAGFSQNAQISGTLILAPILFLTCVALIFIRFFPMIPRFLSGESSAVIHITTLGILLVELANVFVRGMTTNHQLDISTIILLLLLGLSYFATTNNQNRILWGVGLIVQSTIVLAIVLLNDTLASNIILVGIIPAQIIFQILKYSRNNTPSWMSLALWNTSRNPLQHSWLVLLLILTSGISTLSIVINSTLDINKDDQVRYEVASDVRVTNMTDSRTGWKLLKEYQDIPNVRSVVAGYRTNAHGISEIQTGVDVLSLEAKSFPTVSWYREDFSNESLEHIMGAIQTQDARAQILIPSKYDTLGLWAKLDPTTTPLIIDSIIQDSTGTTHLIPMGNISERSWTLMEAAIPPDIPHPISLVSIQTSPRLIDIPGGVSFDDIHVTNSLDQEVVIEDFESDNVWTTIPSSMAYHSSSFNITNDSLNGTNAGIYHVTRALELSGQSSNTRSNTRGIYISPNGGPLPIVMSSKLMDLTNSQIGDMTVLLINGTRVPTIIQETTHYFPTMGGNNKPFLLCDLDLLFKHLSTLSPNSLITPNEFFIDVDMPSNASTIQTINKITPVNADVLDTYSMLKMQSEEKASDPLVTIGWKMVSLASLAISAILVLVGYSGYIISLASNARRAVALMRSIGITNQQILFMIISEHLITILTGVGLGTWAGFQMSSLIIPTLTLGTENVTPSIPTILSINWKLALFMYTAIFVVFSALIVIIKRSIFNVPIHDIARVNT